MYKEFQLGVPSTTRRYRGRERGEGRERGRREAGLEAQKLNREHTGLTGWANCEKHAEAGLMRSEPEHASSKEGGEEQGRSGQPRTGI